MNMLVTTAAIATAAPIASPSIAADGPDSALVAMGAAFDAQAIKHRSIEKRVEAIFKRITQAVVSTSTSAKCRTDEETLANWQRYEREVGGEEYRQLLKLEEEAVPSDELIRDICRIPATSPAGLAAKAHVLAEHNTNLWRKPLLELDFDEQLLRLLVESMFEANGESVQTYLRSIGA